MSLEVKRLHLASLSGPGDDTVWPVHGFVVTYPGGAALVDTGVGGPPDLLTDWRVVNTSAADIFSSLCGGSLGRGRDLERGGLDRKVDKKEAVRNAGDDQTSRGAIQAQGWDGLRIRALLFGPAILLLDDVDEAVAWEQAGDQRGTCQGAW